MKTPLLIAALMAYSCGQGQKKSFRGTVPSFPITDDPATQSQTYSWDEPDCINQKKTSVGLETAVMTDWSQKVARDLSQPLESLVTPDGLIDPSQIGGPLTAADTYSRVCEKRGGDGLCRNAQDEVIGWAIKTSGQTPRFCNPEGTYTRDSLERVSLTAAFHLRNAVAFLRSTLPEPAQLSGVELKVLATFETLWSPATVGNPKDGRGMRSILVDNASYFPSGNSGYEPFIAILPRRLGSTDDTPRLWESGFVIAHELAHHAEHALGLDHFGDSRRTITRLALSEAFADLLGLASQGLSDASLANIPCLANRAPSQEKFTNGGVKSIDSSVLDALKKVDSKSNASSLTFASSAQNGLSEHQNLCPSSNRLSAHDIGAIFAHAFYNLVMQSFDVLEISPQDRPRLFTQQATRWMKTIEADISVGQHTTRDVESAAKALESTVITLFEDQAHPLTTNLEVVFCQKLSFSFSGLKQTQWFHRSQACS